MSRVSPALRRRVRARAQGLCEYCRCAAELTGHDFTVDHIVPESRRGGSRFGNLCWCCFWCNTFKQARTVSVDPHSGKTFPLFNPRVDNWQDHFRWSHDSTRIIGRTPVGRATLKALRLNRPALTKARRIWVRFVCTHRNGGAERKSLALSRITKA
jgi:hypothetical protein